MNTASRCLAAAIALLASLSAQAQHPAPDSQRPVQGRGLPGIADSDGDGYVSRQEFLDQRAARFARMDRNQDGYFDAQDVGPRMKGRPGAVERLAQRIGELDTDRDGKVSSQEFGQAPIPMFDQADRDGNGSLDKAEIQAVRDQARARFEAARARRAAPAAAPSSAP